MFKKLKTLFIASVAAAAGAVGGLNWDKVVGTGGYHPAKNQCEMHVQTDACNIDQACTWDFDKKLCTFKK